MAHLSWLGLAALSVLAFGAGLDACTAPAHPDSLVSAGGQTNHGGRSGASAGKAGLGEAGQVNDGGDSGQGGRLPLTLAGARDPLPILPIPLRAPDPNARLDLQAVLHRLYDEAGYADYIYTGTPQPPLSAEDDAWARSLVPAR